MLTPRLPVHSRNKPKILVEMTRPCISHWHIQVYKVETAGDCYIIAGALMAVDEEGFMSLEDNPDPRQGADRVMAFSKV